LLSGKLNMCAKPTQSLPFRVGFAACLSDCPPRAAKLFWPTFEQLGYRWMNSSPLAQIDIGVDLHFSSFWAWVWIVSNRFGLFFSRLDLPGLLCTRILSRLNWLMSQALLPRLPRPSKHILAALSVFTLNRFGQQNLSSCSIRVRRISNLSKTA